MTPIIIFLVIAVIIGLGIFNTWMFSEAVGESDPEARAYWVFVVKFWGPIGAIIYYFNRYRE